MSASMATSGPRTRRTLSRYALALACVVVVSTGVALTTLDKQLSVRDILSTIGLNLIASVVFAVIFSVTSSRVQERIQADSMAERHETLSRRLVQTISDINSLYMPVSRFTDGTEFDYEFNRELTRSLESSTSYSFRGTSSRFIPIRLRQGSHLPDRVRVIMLDVKSEKAVIRGASDRKLYISKSLGELAQELIDETLMSLVALFDCRYLCPIEIAFNAASGVTRVELFDDSVYVCIRRYGTARAQSPFPGYLQFRSDSFIWTYQRLELLRRMEIAERVVLFDSRRADSELPGILAEIAGRQVGQAEIAAWRSAYEESMADFARFLGSA